MVFLRILCGAFAVAGSFEPAGQNLQLDPRPRSAVFEAALAGQRRACALRKSFAGRRLCRPAFRDSSIPLRPGFISLALDLARFSAGGARLSCSLAALATASTLPAHSSGQAPLALPCAFCVKY